MSNHAGSNHSNHMDAPGNCGEKRTNEQRPSQTSLEGGLNFVFESGSGVRTGGRNVRSQAAKHGWTSRQRAPKYEDQQTKPKRRKIQHGTLFEGTQAQQAQLFATKTPSPPYCPPHQGYPATAHRAYGLPHELPPTPPVSSTDTVALPPVKWLSWSASAGRIPSPLSSSTTPSGSSERASEECYDKQLPITTATSLSPIRRSSTPFLHVVMNEEYPIIPQVSAAGNPFNAFPVDWTPYYGTMIENYRAVTYKQVREINSDPTFGACVCELPLQTTISESEPALFFAIMSSTAVMLLKGGKTLSISPQWFQSKTVESLNAAISDPKRAFSAATILAVTLIALFESTRGAPEVAASLHQPALRKMVDARGGLDDLYANESRGPSLVRFLVWCDRVISSQSGNPLVFAEWDDESMSTTKWSGIWSRMKGHLKENDPDAKSEDPKKVVELSD